MKKVIIASLMASAISAPAFAETGNGLADASQIFNMDNSHSMELAVLSMDEMKSTEGAFGFGGAVFGVGVYGAQTTYNSWDRNQSFTSNLRNIANNWRWRDAGLSFAGGFVSGGFSNGMLRGAGYTGFRNQITAPIATQAVIRTNGIALGQSSFGIYRW